MSVPVDWAALYAMQQAGLTQADVYALGASMASTATASRPAGNLIGTAIPGGTAAASAAAGTTPPVGTNMTTDANGNPVTQQDATAILSQELATWGFGDDAVQWATQQIQSNNSIDQILFSLRQQPFYVSSIFGQVAAERQKANLPAMTEAQILAYKDAAVGIAQQAGLPPGFIDTPELVKLMGNDVSTSELDQRITQAYTTAIKQAPDVLTTLNSYYGIENGGLDSGHLAAYFLDPTRALPLLTQQLAAAQIGAQAARTGYGPINESTAFGLSQLGVTDQQAKTSFQKLAQEQQLFAPLPGSNEAAIAENVQLGAEFGGNAQDQQAIQQRAQQRAAVFQGNYHFAETQNRGITGLGTVQRNG